MRLSGSCPSIKLLTLVCITSTEKLGNQLAIWEPFKEKLWKVWYTSNEEFSFICFSQKKPVMIKHFQQTSYIIGYLRRMISWNFVHKGNHTHVVVQFYPWFKFYFPLFCGMVMYDNEFKIKENKFKQRKKLNYHTYM